MPGDTGVIITDDSLFIWNQDTVPQPANLWISGTATIATLSVAEILGQGYKKVAYSGTPINVDSPSPITLFSGDYNAAGPGSGIEISFTGTFDDRASINGATMQIELVRNPGESEEAVLTSQKVSLAETQTYTDEIVSLTALDLPTSPGTQIYAIRAMMLYSPLSAGRFIKGNMQMVEIKN